MRGTMMRLFTKEQHIEILRDNPTSREAQAEYFRRSGKTISERTVRYWRNIFLENAGNLVATDRALASERVLLSPQPDDDIGSTTIPLVAERILVIPDMHAPYHHPDTLDFLSAVKDRFTPDLGVCLGDEVDNHALSFHDSDPNLDSAGTELERSKQFLAALHTMFPELLICHSNHGSMVYRRAKAHGIPVQMIKRYRDILAPDTGVPGWSWAYSWKVDTALGPVMFKHQATNVLTEAAHNACNLIVGHNHGDFNIAYSASSAHLYYGVTAGCLIDKNSLAFAYGKHTVRKPIVGCVMVLEGRPVLIPMILKPNGRWVGAL